MADLRAASDDRTASQIEADLGATRDRLGASISALIDQVHPNRIKQRQLAAFQQLAETARENARSLLYNARGDLRKERLGVAAGAVAGLVGFVVIVRAIARRGRRP